MMWTGTKKQSGMHRSRFVGREIKTSNRSEDKLDPSDVFSAMPPAEGLRMILPSGMTPRQGEDYNEFVRAARDIARAIAGSTSSRNRHNTFPKGQSTNRSKG